MPVTFKTDSYPNITLLGEDALAMLKMLGHSPTVPGSIRAEEVAHALGLLETAIAASKGLPTVNIKVADEPGVTVAQRGRPLIDLFTAAIKARSYVTWDRSTFID
jgi:hypothetical protein